MEISPASFLPFFCNINGRLCLPLVCSARVGFWGGKLDKWSKKLSIREFFLKYYHLMHFRACVAVAELRLDASYAFCFVYINQKSNKLDELKNIRDIEIGNFKTKDN